MADIFEQIANAIYNGDEAEAERLAHQVIENNISPEDAIKKGGIVGLDRLGQDFEALKVFLPELMIAADAMKSFMEVLKPYLSKGTDSSSGKVVIGCAKGDLHDIGKDLVRTQLAINGFDVIDLGVDVSPNEFIGSAMKNKADIIAISSLLTTSAYYMEEVINNLVEDGIRDKFKIIIGGGPIDANYARKVGADGYAKTAFGAVDVCKELVKRDKIDELIVWE